MKWKRGALQEWQREPASRYLDLHLARKAGNPWKGGYGKYDREFREAFGHKSYVGYPSFALYKNGELERTYSGMAGWNRIERRVREEAKRMEKRQSKTSGSARA